MIIDAVEQRDFHGHAAELLGGGQPAKAATEDQDAMRLRHARPFVGLSALEAFTPPRYRESEQMKRENDAMMDAEGRTMVD
jgi:hypothetical protein